MADDVSKTAVALILLLTVARGIVYLLVIPPWQSPDETSHFAYVRFVTQNHCLPAFGRIPVDGEIVDSMSRSGFWQLRYQALGPPAVADSTELRVASKHPPLYYLLGTLLLMPLEDEAILGQLYVLRLASVLMAALTVLVAVRTVKMMVPDDPVLPLAVGSFIAFLPMHSFMSASVNNDNLAELTASLLIYLLVRMFRDGMSSVKVLGLIMLLGAGYFTKRTIAYTIPLVVISVPVYLRTRRYGVTDCWLTIKRRARGLAQQAKMIGIALAERVRSHKRACILVLIGFICGALCFPLAAQRWAPSLRTTGRFQAGPAQEPSLPPSADPDHPSDSPCLEMTARQILKFARISPAYLEKSLSPDAASPSSIGSYLLFGLLTFASFWGNFGWMNIPLDPIWYAMLATITLVALSGLCLRISRERQSTAGQPLLREPWQRGSFVVLLVASLLIFLQTSSLMVIQNIPQQGRYLFPAIVPLSTLFMIGLREFTPSSCRHALLLLFIFALFLLDTVCLTHYIIPHFYG